uniref:Retrovirus-related Pol polyprotein from transposon TNT 1-94 n=1 Tax=Nicotiana tabacum TaxID=4097 RepID=A0A1S4BGR3_TOBAC|nr:PREDICTED: uncharacterized protein LOC107808097 [Nicotiana tabacum]
MGLNDSYSQARSQILIMNPTPTINQAYALIINDESQKLAVAASRLLGANLTMSANHYDVVMHTRTRHGGNQKFKKNYNIQCDFCKMKGHNKENCCKIVGYPPEFKNRKKGKVGNAVHRKAQLQYGTRSYYLAECNAVGISTACLASTSLQEWIIDTGAINHMVVDIGLLNKASIMQPHYPKKVFLPNGDITHVAHTGSSNISNRITNLFNGQGRVIGREDIHVDLWGPYKLPTTDGSKYFLTVVDDYTRFNWIYLLKLKSDVSTMLQKFIAFVRTQFDKLIKVIRTYNGTEFVNSKSKKQTTVPKSSAEVEYRSIVATMAELIWMIGLLKEVDFQIKLPVEIYSDNKASMQVATNPGAAGARVACTEGGRRRGILEGGDRAQVRKLGRTCEPAGARNKAQVRGLGV